MRVSAIGSPIGKVSIALPVVHEVERLNRVSATAHALGTRFIRIFSFYCDEHGGADANRDPVMERMAALCEVARAEDLVLLHENEKEIYGDSPERVVDLI
jgi:sugar phosphate isomerase/epimerase